MLSVCLNLKFGALYCSISICLSDLLLLALTMALELKYFDGSRAESTISNSGVIASPSLLLIAGGSESQERLGREIWIKSIQLTGRCLLPKLQLADATSETLRLVVYLDRQPNGGVPNVNDVLKTGVWNSYLNLENAARFKILSNKFFDMNALAAGGTQADPQSMEVAQTFRIYSEVGELCSYLNETALYGALQDMNIGVLAITTSSTIDMGYRWRVRFTD